MDVENSQSQLTVIFDPPFYKAIFERRLGTTYEVAQVNLGTSEPKMTLILDLVINHWDRFHCFKQEHSESKELPKKISPKRRQRLAQKSIEKGRSTKAQAALQQQFDQKKQKLKVNRRVEKVQLQEKRFKLRQAKRIEKHKGH